MIENFGDKEWKESKKGQRFREKKEIQRKEKDTERKIEREIDR